MKKLKIGRLPDNDIVISDASVSRYHAELTIENNQYHITDLNSSNGTFINGNKLLGTQKLEINDILKVGSTLVPWRNYIPSNIKNTQETKNYNEPKLNSKPDYSNNDDNQEIIEDDSFNTNIFKYLFSVYNNKPWWFLLVVTAIIGESFWFITCCLIPSIKVEFEVKGWEMFLSTNGLIILFLLIIPILLSLFAALKMINHFITGKNYPGGEGPYGFIQFLSLLVYLLVTITILKMWYDLLMI